MIGVFAAVDCCTSQSDAGTRPVLEEEAGRAGQRLSVGGVYSPAVAAALTPDRRLMGTGSAVQRQECCVQVTWPATGGDDLLA
jgi:hypothetical protein